MESIFNETSIVIHKVGIVIEQFGSIIKGPIYYLFFILNFVIIGSVFYIIMLSCGRFCNILRSKAIMRNATREKKKKKN
jgi:hypothetical protein